MKTILVPTDLSPLADGALQVAVDLARTYSADILLVHYIPFSIARANTMEGAMAMASYLDEQDDVAVADLQEIADNPLYKDIKIIPITSRDAGGVYEAMTEPLPHQRSDQVSRPERQPDLIVLATHGTSGWDEWLFGSNAEHIVRHAHCPVLVIKQAVVPFAPTNAVAAIDMDDVLKNRWPAYPFGTNGNSLKQFVYVSTPSDSRDPQGIQDWMRELAEEKGIADYELHIRHARSVEQGILNYAIERQADLIVVYTHGHTGLRHLLQGSVAEDVLNHAPVPVLILPIRN